MITDEDIKAWSLTVVAVGPDVPLETREALKREGFKVLDHNWQEWRNEPEETNDRQRKQSGPRNRWGQLR